MLDVRIIVPGTGSHDKVNWQGAYRAQEIMEECGLFAVHCLTFSDIRSAYDERLTDDQCEEILCKIQHKDTSWEWDETVRHYGSAMFPKEQLPGKDPDEENDA